MQRVPVIAAVGLADVAQGRLQIELPAHRARVVPGHERRAHPELRHQTPARVPVVEVPAKAEESECHFIIARERCRADHGVVDGVILRHRVVHIEEEFGCEVGSIENCLVLTARAVQPCKVAECEGLGGLFVLRGCGRGRLRGWWRRRWRNTGDRRRSGRRDWRDDRGRCCAGRTQEPGPARFPPEHVRRWTPPARTRPSRAPEESFGESSLSLPHSRGSPGAPFATAHAAGPLP